MLVDAFHSSRRASRPGRWCGSDSRPGIIRIWKAASPSENAFPPLDAIVLYYRPALSIRFRGIDGTSLTLITAFPPIGNGCPHTLSRQPRPLRVQWRLRHEARGI